MATKEQPVSTQVGKQSDSVTSNNALQFTDIRRRSMPFVTLDKLLSDIEPLVNEPATTFAVIQRMMNRLDEYSIARMQCEEEDPRWILTALQATDNNITPWIASLTGWIYRESKWDTTSKEAQAPLTMPLTCSSTKHPPGVKSCTYSQLLSHKEITAWLDCQAVIVHYALINFSPA